MSVARTRGWAVGLVAIAAVAAGCSSDNAATPRANADDPAVTNAVTDGSVTDATTAAPAPATDGEWPPADACSLLDPAAAAQLTGQTLSFEPVANAGEFVYGPYCEYTSDASGLFMTISTYSPADLAGYTEGWVDSGRAVVQPGIGESALLEMNQTINDSRVYVTSGNRAFSVQIVSFSDNGWTPQIATDIAVAVAAAVVGG